MARYSVEKKEWILRQMMAPLNRPISELAEETGIHVVTLYSWRRKARESGVVMPGNGKGSDDWSSAEKFRVVLETMTLSETELSEHCRSKGLYPEQVAQWREACETDRDSRLERELERFEKDHLQELLPILAKGGTGRQALYAEALRESGKFDDCLTSIPEVQMNPSLM